MSLLGLLDLFAKKISSKDSSSITNIVKELQATLKLYNTLQNDLFKKNIYLENNLNNSLVISALNSNTTVKETEDVVKKNPKILIISEKAKKVFLPYDISELENSLKHNSKYSSVEEIIENKYTIPLDKYKSSSLARFKESFNLIRKKEKGSLKDALMLGFELMTNYKLHPAVISACNSEDELDIYLNCIEENALDCFNFFDIKFEFSPVLKRTHRFNR